MFVSFCAIVFVFSSTLSSNVVVVFLFFTRLDRSIQIKQYWWRFSQQFACFLVNPVSGSHPLSYSVTSVFVPFFYNTVRIYFVCTSHVLTFKPKTIPKIYSLLHSIYFLIFYLIASSQSSIIVGNKLIFHAQIIHHLW